MARVAYLLLASMRDFVGISGGRVPLKVLRILRSRDADKGGAA